LQGRLSRDDIDPAPPDEIADSVDRLVAIGQSNRSPSQSVRFLPELLPGEAVILVANPASDIDEIVSALVRRSVDEGCSLALVFLVHPLQRREQGLMSRPSGSAVLGLMDRNDKTPEEIDAFLARRIEQLSRRVFP